MTAITSSGNMPRFAIVCAAYKCEQWILRCLRSIRSQSYTNFRCILVDDCSPDATFSLAKAEVSSDQRFSVLQNPKRLSTLPNLLTATCQAGSAPDDVVVVVDGDDCLKHNDVLKRLAAIYSNPEIWLTYGSCELANRPLKARLLGRNLRIPAGPYPRAVRERNLYRYHPGSYLASHLRTYRKFLWDAIRDEDLRDEDGEYFKAGADIATMWPMLEMATDRHIRYMDEILYIYNNDHALSDNRQTTVWTDSEQYRVNLIVRSRMPYTPLQRL